MIDVRPGSSRQQKAAASLKAVDDAYQLIQEAHISYEEAISIVAKTERSFDDILALERCGREYAATVTRYSEALMGWLSLFETNRETAIQSLREAKSVG